VHARLSKLNANLIDLEKKSKVWQQKLISERKEEGIPKDKQNLYQPGDYVLFNDGPKVHPKMRHVYLGPYEVIQQVSNDVFCKHVALGSHAKFDVRSLKIYSNTDKEAAFEAACRDQDQHVIDNILSFKGNLEKRTTLIFTVRFMDGEVKQVKYSKDLFDSVPYEDYCRKKPYTEHLVYTAVAGKEYCTSIDKTNLMNYIVGQHIYLDIRFFNLGGNFDWYHNLKLPDADNICYVSKFTITAVQRRHLDLVSEIYLKERRLRPYEIHCYVHREFDESSMVDIDLAFVMRYPQVK
jgi:hypothetical protein